MIKKMDDAFNEIRLRTTALEIATTWLKNGGQSSAAVEVAEVFYCFLTKKAPSNG